MSGFHPALPEQERWKSGSRPNPISKNKAETSRNEESGSVSFIANQLALSPSIVRSLLRFMSLTQLRMLAAALISGDKKEQREALRRLGRAPEPENKAEETAEEEIEIAFLLKALFKQRPIMLEPIVVAASEELETDSGWHGLTHIPARLSNSLKVVGRVGLSSLRKMNAIIDPRMTPAPLHPGTHTQKNILTDTE